MENSRYIWGYQQGDGKYIYFEDLNSFEVGEPEVRYAETLQFSKEALSIRQHVTRPLHERKPVSYNDSWLRGYRPNQDFYLTKEERQQLRRIGTTEERDQPAGSFARKMLERLLIDLSWNSSRLEGNSYSLLDTERLIIDQEISEQRTTQETRMILNHKKAIELIVNLADQFNFTPFNIRNLHGILSYRLLDSPKAEGRLREIPVGIGHSVYTPLVIPALIEELFTLMLEKASQIQDPFEQSFFMLVHIPYLQPFEDVNKRTSRLAANIPLNRHNLIPLSFVGMDKNDYIHGLLGVYELNNIALYKETYIWAYERSVKNYAQVRQILRKPDPFVERYHYLLHNTVTKVIAERMSKANASKYVDETTRLVPSADREKFSEAASLELLSVHEGNIVRYNISLETFRAWKEQW